MSYVLVVQEKRQRLDILLPDGSDKLFAHGRLLYKIDMHNKH